MQERVQVALEKVSLEEIAEFQIMAEMYWQELMPHATVIQDKDQRQGYFEARFTWEGGNRHPLWAIAAERKVGFLSIELSPENKSATVEDFFVVPAERRKGFGAGMVRALTAHLDRLDIELIELNVRRDNPRALSFWEAQGFRVGSFRLRQYRDPKTGTGFIGALSSDFATKDEALDES